MNKLPKRFKERWIKALLSGKYKQGRGYLYEPTTECYCALGVAGDVLGVPKTQLSYTCTLDNFLLTKEPIPGQLMHTGLGSIANKIATFNDQKYRSFRWIAYYIKRYL